jgi:hypothetical protein
MRLSPGDRELWRQGQVESFSKERWRERGVGRLARQRKDLIKRLQPLRDSGRSVCEFVAQLARYC